MSGLDHIFRLSASGMEAQSDRLRRTSENIANVDTPGYRRKIAAFEMEYERGLATGSVRSGPVQLDQSTLTEIYDPSHPLADQNGYYAGSNVELMFEVADAREAQRSFEANLKMFDQARKMTSSLLDLLRR